MKIITFIVLLFDTFSVAFARPVSYPDGWTLMQINELDTHQLHIHYSPTAKYSVGIKSEYWRDEDIRFNGIQYNRLLKRWNKPQEQANLYFKAGLGNANQDQSVRPDNQLAFFTGFAADWETRRWFTAYENRYHNFKNHGRYFSQKLRLGVAPYIGDYGDLHTWLMLQVDHHPKKQKNYSLTPFLRFFKGPYMLETGYSNRDEFLLNLIIRL